MKKARLLFVLLAIGGAVALSATTPASSDSKSSLTYSKDVAPIFYKNCATCHRNGEIAPMSLISYKEVRPWAKAIREKVLTREMPPWHADPQHGEWANDRRMSQKEVDTIISWIDQGAAEGTAKDLPTMPKFAEGWQIGEPDLVIYMPEEFTVPAEGAVPYQYFPVPTSFPKDTYLVGLEARAGNLSVVHHIVIYVREPGKKQSRRLDLGDGILGALSPGQTPFMAEPGTAKLIKAGSQLIFQMHYTPNGVATKDRSYLGLKFAKEPVNRLITSTGAFDVRFVIPPGAANHEVRASYEFEQDAEIISLMPHMHVRGKDYTYKAIYPDGRSEIILSVPKYDFNWQVYYYPKKPLKMPKGTRIEAIAHYDNSTSNPLNPEPNKEVRFGEQTWEEMMNGFFDIIVSNPATEKPESTASKGSK